VPRARWRGSPPRLTRPWRSRTAWMVLLAGTLTSPSSRRTRSSRILRAPQCGSRPSAGQSGSQPAAAAGWRSAPDGVTDRSGPQARAPCSDRISCSQSCGIPRNPGRRPSWPPRPTGGRQSEGALPSPNSLSTASTPPAAKAKSVTHVSGTKCHLCLGPLSPAVFDIPAVGDTGRFPAGGTCATQIDRALLKRKRVGRQELASEANVSRRSASSAGR
jgi:hypothetical protein